MVDMPAASLDMLIFSIHHAPNEHRQTVYATTSHHERIGGFGVVRDRQRLRRWRRDHAYACSGSGSEPLAVPLTHSLTFSDAEPVPYQCVAG